MPKQLVTSEGDQLWMDWGRRVLAGGSAKDALLERSDEELIEMLASTPTFFREERELLCDEARRRMARARDVVAQTADVIAEEILQIQALVVRESIRAGDEDASAGATQGYEERNAAREAALEHAEATAALASLSRASDKLEVLKRTMAPQLLTS